MHCLYNSLDGSLPLRFAPLVAEDGSDEDYFRYFLFASGSRRRQRQPSAFRLPSADRTGLPQYAIDNNGRVLSLNFGNGRGNGWQEI